MIILTFDSDWVPPFILDDLARLLAEGDLRGTLFVTDKEMNPAEGRLEVGLHPNLMADSTQGKTPADVIAMLTAAHAGARSIRTHRLFWHGGLLSLLAKAGLRYDGSSAMPFHPGLRPVRIGGLLRLPIWWGDNLHLMEDLPCDRVELPALAAPGLKVFNFHPIHLYLNTVSLADYRATMQSIRSLPEATPEMLAPYVQKGPGLRDFFKALAGNCRRANEGRLTFSEVMAESEVATPYHAIAVASGPFR